MAIMFIIFAFGTLRISFRQALLIWLFSTLAISFVITLNGDAMVWLPPHPGNPEYYLAAISFALILLRTIMLGYYATLLRQRMYEKGRAFEQDATHDPLTGILNRRMLPSIVDEQISLLKRKHIPACVAMIDIDRFKSINDIYGHAVGDIVLKSMVSHLRWGIRESDKLIRYGGEEFVLVLAATDLAEAGALMERIRRAIALQSWQALDEAQKITISIGFSEILPADQTGDPIKRADQALYEAKRSGRDRVIGFTDFDLEQPAAEPR
jgi:diguanylate cyclase